MEEKPKLYNNAVQALRQLLLSNLESGKKAKITNSSNRILTTREGLAYFFVEVSDPRGTTYRSVWQRCPRTLLRNLKCRKISFC